MKQYIRHIVLFVWLLSISNWCSGADWSGKMSGTMTISETINITGTVVIESGKTLTINPSGANRTIRPNASLGSSPMFKIEDGGTLVIKGKDGYKIVINGRTTFDGTIGSSSVHPFTINGSTVTMATRSTTYKMSEAIQNLNGTLTLENVVIQNIYGIGPGGAILIDGENKGESRITSIKNCTIRNCMSEQGSAIQITNDNIKEKKGNAEKCKVVIEDTTIEWNFSWGDYGEQHNGENTGSGGTIRTNGNCVSNVYLTRVKVKNNFSGGSGGGIYWNGAGTASTCCTFDGCTFDGNIARGQGGGMMLETTFVFNENGEKTVVKNNKALADNSSGGGIVITSYGGNALGVVSTGKYVFNYTFTEKLEVTGNTASQGGGISFNFQTYRLNGDWNDNNKDTYSVTSNINFNGAIISGNTATGFSGGGIRLYNNTAGNNGNRQVYINVNLNKGTLSNNTAEAYGGGLYTYKADVKYSSSDGTLTIQNNTATNNNGGGIYVDGGSLIELAATDISGNHAKNGGALAISEATGSAVINLGTSTISKNYATENGGAIYLLGGNVTIADPVITSNGIKDGVVTTQNGGAIYIGGTGAGLTTTGDVRIEGNKSTTAGGAVYVSNGNVTLSQSTITSNASANGGAFYVTGGSITTAGGTVSNNVATNEGGVFYVNNGNINLGAIQITNNSAVNGGAISLHNGAFEIDPMCVVTSNTATGNGGGLYVSNTGKTGTTITCQGGSFYNNSATNGGGIYASGNPSNKEGKITLIFAANVEGNTASNGGGIYMSDYVNMTFGDGLIKSNEAVQPIDDTTTYTTANNKKAGSVTGVGGGIFMADNSTLTFNSVEMGIYGNSATNAGADICSNGNGTTIGLPNITKMNLKGFDVIGNQLYWVQDYFTNDTGIPSSTPTGIRYEDALEKEVQISEYIVPFGDDDTMKDITSYICLDLGYDLVFVTLTTENLVGDEIIMMSYPKKQSDGTFDRANPIVYRTVSVDDDTRSVVVVGLPSGEWQFRTKEWNYKCEVESYDPVHKANGYIDIGKDVCKAVKIIFKKKTENGVQYIKENFHRKVNRMKAKTN